MKISATTTGILNEFTNFYGQVKFNYDNEDAYEIAESFMSEDVDLNESDFWCASFKHHDNTYFIAANGGLTSGGTYCLAMKMK